ncbi:hypothetical protein DCF38_04120 [Edwardsiella piscicida]|uniref:hypothetical protein n=1 Tax=Edwardsiella piscicida TaxID=1263550 RepID=UPI000D52482F|nr:hypothetical protein [Edwardsiella piscicida]UCQ41951.1 hypothetical protein DCF38_04120 [Edwardsiella piscicida]
MQCNNVNKLCSVIRKRSAEHALAISRMNDLPGMMASILRQELDSMVRAIYLLSEKDVTNRERLAGQTLTGEKWTSLSVNNKMRTITDKEMVDLANDLQGWSKSVYKFGCAFIHLSIYHDYSEKNPFDSLGFNERSDILSHLRHYHGGPSNDNPSFSELAEYFPNVFEKISDNLVFYLECLEGNKTSLAAL